MITLSRSSEQLLSTNNNSSDVTSVGSPVLVLQMNQIISCQVPSIHSIYSGPAADQEINSHVGRPWTQPAGEEEASLSHYLPGVAKLLLNFGSI